MKYAKYFIVASLALFALGTFSPPLTRAAETPVLIISDSLRSSLLQLITLLQRLQTLKLPSVVKPVPVVISTVVTPTVPASQQILPFIEGFSLPAPPPRSSTLKIVSVSPQSGEPGTVVTITGQGFSSSMTLYGGFQSQTISSSDGKTVTFIVAPDMKFSSDLPKVTDNLFLYLEDSSGISNVGTFSLSL